MIWTLWVPVVLAGAPSVVVQEDGSVVGTVWVQVPPELVRSRVSDPVWVSRTDGSGTTITVAGRDGACLLLDVVTTSVVVDMHYTTRQCPTQEGVSSTLRSADVFTAYTTSWRVIPEGSGSRLEYRLYMQTSLVLPQSFVASMTQKGVRNLLERVGAALDG